MSVDKLANNQQLGNDQELGKVHQLRARFLHELKRKQPELLTHPLVKYSSQERFCQYLARAGAAWEPDVCADAHQHLHTSQHLQTSQHLLPHLHLPQQHPTWEFGPLAKALRGIGQLGYLAYCGLKLSLQPLLAKTTLDTFSLSERHALLGILLSLQLNSDAESSLTSPNSQELQPVKLAVLPWQAAHLSPLAKVAHPSSVWYDKAVRYGIEVRLEASVEEVVEEVVEKAVEEVVEEAVEETVEEATEVVSGTSERELVSQNLVSARLISLAELVYGDFDQEVLVELARAIAYCHYWGIELVDLRATGLFLSGGLASALTSESLEDSSGGEARESSQGVQGAQGIQGTQGTLGAESTKQVLSYASTCWYLLNLSRARLHLSPAGGWAQADLRTLLTSLNGLSGSLFHAGHWQLMMQAYREFFSELAD